MGKDKQNSATSDWFEQALSSRITDVCDLCDDHAQELYTEFITKLRSIVPTDSPLYFEIENLFNSQIRKAAETAYPLGLYDGIALAAKVAG